jgi:hypothetical protein
MGKINKSDGKFEPIYGLKIKMATDSNSVKIDRNNGIYSK